MARSQLTILILVALGLVPAGYARALQQPGEAAGRCSSGGGVGGSAVLEGEVRDSGSGVRLPGVWVLAVVPDSGVGGSPTAFGTMTGAHGHYRLCGLPAGVPLRVRASLHARSGPPVDLEPIVVSVVRNRKLELRGFYERRQWGERLGLGTLFTRADIEKRQPGRATDVLRAVPGVRVACAGRGTRSCVIRMAQTAPSLSRRALGGCYTANVYVDGVWVIRADRGPGAGPSLDEIVKPADVALDERGSLFVLDS
ncbi:MAG: hypothetical protein ACE5HQ_12125 [Gemmatimonadota bacterium]